MELYLEFRQKLKERKIPLTQMFNKTGIHKSVFSYIKNEKVSARKLTQEKMKYWMKHNKTHPAVKPKKGYFFCVQCLNLLPIETLISKKNKAGNRCKPCEVIRQKHWDARNPERTKARRRRDKKRLLTPGPKRDSYLETRKVYYLKKQYGDYWQCARTIQEIRSEYGKSKFGKLTESSLGDFAKIAKQKNKAKRSK